MRRLTLPIVLLLAMLGGVAWWFYVAGTPWQAALSRVTMTPEHGIKMEKFALRDTARHQTRWEILADVAQANPQGTTTTMEGVHLTLYSANHGTILVVARRGVIDNQSKNMQVCGDVRLVMGDELALTTECLQWIAAEQTVVTETPVSIQMGGLHVEGQGFQGWIADERFEVRENVLARWSEP